MLFRKGLFESRKLPCSVISVGNITLGGSGKTPTVHYISQLLRANNLRVAVLSRGYKGKGGNKINIVSDEHRVLLSPEVSGDEPYMLAKKLNGTPVLTSKNRFTLGEYALKHFNSNVLILDDGFQHVRLKRDMDLVLLDTGIISSHNRLFPRGILREPLKNLKRADAFIITRVNNQKDYNMMSRAIKRITENAAIFFGDFQVKHLLDPSGQDKGLGYLKGKRVLAFSGIANPKYFSLSLQELGAIVVEELVFPDHHWYSAKDWDRIGRLSEKVDFAVTTEKDMVKIEKTFFDNIETLALSIELCLDREEEFRGFLLERIGGVTKGAE